MDHTERRPIWIALGSVATAIVASACCIGPLVFALLGLGGAAFLVELTPFRPYFILVTLALLGGGFWVAYRKPRAASGEACECELPRAHRAGRIALWILTAVIGVLLASPYLIPLVWRSS